jgi:hypothetical protein
MQLERLEILNFLKYSRFRFVQNYKSRRWHGTVWNCNVNGMVGTGKMWRVARCG